MNSNSDTTGNRELGDPRPWNQAFGVTGISGERTPQELSPQLPDRLETVDKHAFMERLRVLASQI